MRDLRSPPALRIEEPASGRQLPAARAASSVSPFGGIVLRGFKWSQHLLAGVGLLTIVSFAFGVTPIPEKIGEFTGRVAAATTEAQIKAQAALQGAIAGEQQSQRVAADKQLQLYQAQLQADLAGLNSALEAVKLILVQKTALDLQARNALLQTNAQLQADRVRQITQLQEKLQNGEIVSAQILDMTKNLVKAMNGDASRLQSQSEEIKAEVLDSVARVTPLEPEESSAVLAPLEQGILDPNVATALAAVEKQVAQIQARFAIRQPLPAIAAGAE